ncbi:MAG: carbohydrate binding domain-containing protein [Clostridia bacterium]|nr:carbohydrate binding domain-containing protein [Clostridia bacterium]
MRGLHGKILLPILCAIALLTSVAGAFLVSGSETAPQVEIVPKSVSEILERDGYLEGIWYPWFTHYYLGSGLTANPDNEERDGSYDYVNDRPVDYWQDFNKIGIDQYGVANLRKEIFNLKALGYNILGYEGSPWGEGIIHDQDTGDVLGVREDYLQNIRRFLDICREVDMPVLWAMCFHTSAAVHYSNLDLWYFVCQMYSNPEIARHYADRFVRPVCEVLKEYPDVVVMTCSTVELENEINDSQLGNHMDSGDRETYGVTQDDAVHFVKVVTAAMKDVMPDTPVTIATNSSNFAMYADCDFDMVGRNQYSSNANSIELTQYYATAPMLATEWGVSNDVYAESTLSTHWQNFRKSFMNNHYTGWFQWAWEPTANNGGGHQLLKNGAANTYDFRQATYEQYYYIESYRAAARPEHHTTGKPSILYNDGDRTVYWIQPKGVTTYTLERSVDGGPWTTMAKDTGAVTTTDTGGYRYTYIDNVSPDGSTVRYRVTVNGHTSTSNAAVLPTNLVVNGGFENGKDGWYVGSHSAITAAHAFSGDYAVLVAEPNQWGLGAQQTGIPVEKNTDYKISFYTKRISGTGTWHLYVKDQNIKDYSVNGASWFRQTTGDWTYTEFTFNSGNSSVVHFHFQAEVANAGSFAIDDVRMVKVG